MSKLYVALPAALLILGNGAAIAGKTEEEKGVFVCVTDKWDEKEPEKGHKLVDYASRCVIVPDDTGAPKVTEACTGNFEYMPDKTWKANGVCTDTYPGGDKKSITWEEGSHLKEYTYTVTGGTGRYQGVKGGGTYMYENLTDTLSGGRVNGKLELP